MTDQEKIEKAKKILIEIGIYSEAYIEESVNQTDEKQLIEVWPEFSSTYTVNFSSNGNVGMESGATVIFERNSNKVIKVFNKQGFYEIPEHLK